MYYFSIFLFSIYWCHISRELLIEIIFLNHVFFLIHSANVCLLINVFSITIKETSGGDGIPVELFQILKDDAVKVLHSICQQIWKTQPWPQDWKRSVFIPIPKKCNAKECWNFHTVVLISHVSKVVLKILQARLQ